MRVSVVIPNWNGANLLKKNLPSVLKAQENNKNSISEIIVVDDGSTDDSLEVLDKFDVKVVELTKNLGFSHAVNAGVKAASGDLVCLLNTDVIPDKNFLVAALTHFKSKTTFGVSFNEGQYGPAIIKFSDGFFNHNSVKSTKPKETAWASGGSGIFSKRIWNQLGGLDAKLFSPFYWEDVDIGYRAMKRGLKIYWEPKSVVDHKHESVINPSNFKKSYMNIIKERNQLLFMWKNITSKALIKKHYVGLAKRTLRHPGYLKVIFAALTKVIPVLSRRRVERKRSKISDETIFSKFSK